MHNFCSVQRLKVKTNDNLKIKGESALTPKIIFFETGIFTVSIEAKLPDLEMILMPIFSARKLSNKIISFELLRVRSKHRLIKTTIKSLIWRL